MSLMDKIKKASSEGEAFSESKYMNDIIPIDVPAMNIALSGDIDGGLENGLTTIAGPSKHFKSGFSLILMKAYLDYYPDAVAIFYDSEFGATEQYFENTGVDTSRVFHEVITDIEEFKFKIVPILENLENGDHVFIMADSIGNLASKKEAKDASEQNSAADMTRAKELKSLYRIITPKLKKLGIPMVSINHSYNTMDFISKEVMSGGQGPMLASDNVWLVGRRQQKTGKEVSGYEFVIKSEKSRSLKEGSKIPVRVDFDKGIYKYSGLLDMALQTGHVISPKHGWYSRIIPDENGEIKSDKNWRMNDLIDSDEFWKPIFDETDFKQQVREMYQLGGKGKLIEVDKEEPAEEITEKSEEAEEENE